MLSASKQVGNPMFFGVVIITVVYIPILALTGIEGKMFHPMALTVMLALGGALLLALTLMPVLCSFVLRGKIQEGDNLVIRFIKRVYEPTLYRFTAASLARRRWRDRVVCRFVVVVQPPWGGICAEARRRLHHGYALQTRGDEHRGISQNRH